MPLLTVPVPRWKNLIHRQLHYNFVVLDLEVDKEYLDAQHWGSPVTKHQIGIGSQVVKQSKSLLTRRSFRPELPTAERRLWSWLMSNFPPTDLIHDRSQGAGPASGPGLAHIGDKHARDKHPRDRTSFSTRLRGSSVGKRGKVLRTVVFACCKKV